jgi:hypothetical protein
MRYDVNGGAKHDEHTRLFFVVWLTVVYFILPILLNAQAQRKCSYKKSQNANIQQRSELVEDEGQKIFIPIVVHILHSTQQQNISNEQVFSQIKVLNEDFSRNNSDTVNTLTVFRQYAGNVNIVFFLANQDELGNVTSGITRTSTTHGPFANDDIHFTDKGGENAWQSSKYLNIWVCDLADGVFGFASMPQSDPLKDGAVIDFNFFGSTGIVSSPFDKGRTATHEVGHWLGLKHLWGNAGGCVDDDGIADTPQQSGPSSGCDLGKTSCGGLNMVQNFMDNSTDECMNIFTKGQAAEMRRILFSFRPEIIQDQIVTSADESRFSGIELTPLGQGIYLAKSQHPIDLISFHNLLGQRFPLIPDQSSENEATLDFSGVTGVFILSILSGHEVYVKKIALN